MGGELLLEVCLPKLQEMGRSGTPHATRHKIYAVSKACVPWSQQPWVWPSTSSLALSGTHSWEVGKKFALTVCLNIQFLSSFQALLDLEHLMVSDPFKSASFVISN